MVHRLHLNWEERQVDSIGGKYFQTFLQKRQIVNNFLTLALGALWFRAIAGSRWRYMGPWSKHRHSFRRLRPQHVLVKADGFADLLYRGVEFLNLTTENWRT